MQGLKYRYHHCMDIFYFMIRHTPFWAVPMVMICAQFARTYWTREFRRTGASFALASFISLLFIVFYFGAGGPEKAPVKLQEIIQAWL